MDKATLLRFEVVATKMIFLFLWRLFYPLSRDIYHS